MARRKDKKFGEVLELPEKKSVNPDDVNIEVEPFLFNDNMEDDVDDDYKYIRSKLRFSIAAAEKVLMYGLADLAITPSARVVEGCSTIIKVMTDTTEQLLKVHEKMGKVKAKKPKVEDEENGGIVASINDIIDEMNK